MKYIITFFLLAIGFMAYGQLDIKIETTLSTCENNGTAIITVDGAVFSNGETNISFIITSGPMDMGEISCLISSSAVKQLFKNNESHGQLDIFSSIA